EIAAELDRLLVERRLTVRAGRIRNVEASARTAALHLTTRNGPQSLAAPWLIDCTGPGHDATTAPLTADLIAHGRARLAASGLGLDLDQAGRVLHADGTPDLDLYVLGPPARAAFWETVAVPDIRQRIE